MNEYEKELRDAIKTIQGTALYNATYQNELSKSFATAVFYMQFRLPIEPEKNECPRCQRAVKKEHWFCPYCGQRLKPFPEK